MPKINDFLKGFQDNLPGLKDFRHASRLYLDDNFKLAPKNKFLFHVVFDTDEDLFYGGFNSAEKYQLNMLVKSADLPKYGMNLEEKIQYNKKVYTATRIQYEPVNIVFHDDQADTVNAFWKKYYEYYIADPKALNTDLAINQNKDDTYDPIDGKTRYRFGLDTGIKRKQPYLRTIQLFVLHKKRFTSMTLVNPVIGSFSHDNVDQADGAGVLSNTMQVFYETVVYASGIIVPGELPKGFATLNYDKEPSPLTVFGRGTNSIFGPGGVVDGIGSAIKQFQEGNILGAILAAGNTYNNAKKIKKSDAKAELKGIAKKGVQEIGKQAGSISNPVAQFAVGAASLLAIKSANAKGTNDQQNKANTKVISSPSLDTTNFLSPDEAFNLVNTNATVKNQVAAGIYFKDIRSRKNLTVAQSDIEYNNANATTKTVYQNKAITNVRKLVTEGYLKISRQTLNVNIETEKANI